MKTKAYVCPRHGDQGRYVGVMIDFRRAGDLPASLKIRSERKYCMACWIDWMDENMEPLAEVEQP